MVRHAARFPADLSGHPPERFAGGPAKPAETNSPPPPYTNCPEVRHVLRSLRRQAARSGELLSSLREAVRRRATAADGEPRCRPSAQRSRPVAGVFRFAVDTGPVSAFALKLGVPLHGRRPFLRA